MTERIALQFHLDSDDRRNLSELMALCYMSGVDSPIDYISSVLMCMLAEMNVEPSSLSSERFKRFFIKGALSACVKNVQKLLPEGSRRSRLPFCCPMGGGEALDAWAILDDAIAGPDVPAV